LSSDERTIVFSSDRTNLPRLYIADRQLTSQPFGAPTAAGAVALLNPSDVTKSELDPYLSQDGTRIYYAEGDSEAGQYQLRVAARSDTSQPFGAPSTIGIDARSPVLSADGLTLYYGDVAGREKIFVKTRTTTGGAFGGGKIIDELEIKLDSGILNQLPTGLSSDGCTLYFVSTRAGKAYNAYRATRGK
jgi:Tol biopolymer transport system component